MSIYSSNSLEFYVYIYLRKDGSPYYVGKGKGNRVVSNNRTIRKPKDLKNIIICESNLTELGAFALERRLIRWYGRKDNGTGILRNRTDGGEGASGVVCSNETRQKLSKSKIGVCRPPLSDDTKKKISEKLKGIKRSDETKKKMSKPKSPETLIKMSESRKGEKNHNFGKKMSDEFRKKLSEIKKHMSIETKNKMSESRKGEKNHNFGKKMSDETKRKISESKRKKSYK